MKNAGSHWESNPGPLTSATSALTTELWQPETINTTIAPLSFLSKMAELWTCNDKAVCLCTYNHSLLLIETYLAWISVWYNDDVMPCIDTRGNTNDRHLKLLFSESLIFLSSFNCPNHVSKYIHVYLSIIRRI